MCYAPLRSDFSPDGNTLLAIYVLVYNLVAKTSSNQRLVKSSFDRNTSVRKDYVIY